jgi:hypothetical protein
MAELTVEIPNAGHRMLADYPEATLAMIDAFLSTPTEDR